MGRERKGAHTSGIARTKLPISAPPEAAAAGGFVTWSKGFTDAVADADAGPVPADCPGCSAACGCGGRMGFRNCVPRRVVRKRSTESGVVVRCRWISVGMWVFGSGRESWRVLGPRGGTVPVPVPVSGLVPCASGVAEGAGGLGELSESPARREAGEEYSVGMVFPVVVAANIRGYIHGAVVSGPCVDDEGNITTVSDIGPIIFDKQQFYHKCR